MKALLIGLVLFVVLFVISRENFLRLVGPCLSNTRKLNTNDGLYYCISPSGAGWVLDPVQEEAMTKEEVDLQRCRMNNRCVNVL
jgi:hypothetical protein